jgi:L-asparaginase II
MLALERSQLERTSMSAALAEVTRGELVESTHTGVVAVVDVSGRIVASAGDTDRVLFFRSSAKPFQAVPLVESGAADAYGFTTGELALACASHDATPAHQRGVARMLAKIGLDEDALRCGVVPPADEQEAARIALGIKANSQLQCECSGEHAGMLAACLHSGYPTDTYTEADHPLQRRIREILASILRLEADALIIGIDGCRIPTFGAPVRAFATAYATLATPSGASADAGRGFAATLDRLRAAMLAHPTLVGGEQTLDSDIMRLSDGRIVAKLGAEGLLCLAVPERGLGIAMAASDGSPRALGPAAIAVLEQLQVAEPQTLDALRERHAGRVETFAGEPVGEMRPAVELEAC